MEKKLMPRPNTTISDAYSFEFRPEASVVAGKSSGIIPVQAPQRPVPVQYAQRGLRDGAQLKGPFSGQRPRSVRKAPGAPVPSHRPWEASGEDGDHGRRWVPAHLTHSPGPREPLPLGSSALPTLVFTPQINSVRATPFPGDVSTR